MPVEFKNFFFHVAVVVIALIAALILSAVALIPVSFFHTIDQDTRYIVLILASVLSLVVLFAYLSTPEGEHWRLCSIGLAEPKPLKQPEPENIVIHIDARDHVRHPVSQSDPQSSSLSPAAQKIADEIARRRGS
jgi:hypothetical protein